MNWQNCFSGYHKDPFLVHFSLLYFYLIYFILSSILILLVIMMTALLKVLILKLKTKLQVSIFLLLRHRVNPTKCVLLFSTNPNKLANTINNAINNSSSEKLFGITIDTNLKFDIHVNYLCKKVSQKLKALISHKCRQKTVCYESLYQFAF